MAIHGHGGMKETPDEMPGLQVERIDMHRFSAFASEIRSLKFNALETSRNREAIATRKKELGPLVKSLRHAGEHDAMFAAMEKGKVVGFLAAELIPQGRKANIRQVWTAFPGRRQGIVVSRLLFSTRSYLTNHGYPNLNYESSGEESSEFKHVTNEPSLDRYLHEKKDATSAASQEKQQTSEHELERVDKAPSIVPEAHEATPRHAAEQGMRAPAEEPEEQTGFREGTY